MNPDYKSSTASSTSTASSASTATTPASQCPPAEDNVFPPWTRPKSASPDGEATDYQPITADFDKGPIDYLTGMSRKAWKLAQETHRMVIEAAGVLGNTTGNGRYVVYDRTRFYTETTWYSTAREYILRNDAEVVWEGQTLKDSVLYTISKRFEGLLDSIADADDGDYSDYFEKADYLAYNIHLQVEKNTFDVRFGAKKVGLNAFYENAYARIYMCTYFLGEKCTRERLDAYTWAIFILNSLNWHFLNLYELGCKARPTINDFTLFDPSVMQSARK
jgi:hypothetical protein